LPLIKSEGVRGRKKTAKSPRQKKKYEEEISWPGVLTKGQANEKK